VTKTGWKNKHKGISKNSNSVIPTKAGIQLINKFPHKWDNTWVLSASQNIFNRWIPAFAGMTT
jgi:hypothetical protein